jgi:hypothetical protein
VDREAGQDRGPKDWRGGLGGEWELGDDVLMPQIVRMVQYVDSHLVQQALIRS